LIDQLQQKGVKPPSRVWVNFFVECSNLNLGDGRKVEPDRIRCGTRAKIEKFFEDHRDLIRSYPNELIFGGDETKINIHKIYNCVMPNQGGIEIEELDKQIPHITGMMVHSATGATVLSFVIGALLRNLRKDIIELVLSGRVWITAFQNGWQT
jgi:hypothetical protein